MNGNFDIKVRKVAEESTLNAAGEPVTVIRVDFMVGDNGPFTERFLKQDFNGPMVKTKLLDFANHLHTLAGY